MSNKVIDERDLPTYILDTSAFKEPQLSALKIRLQTTENAAEKASALVSLSKVKALRVGERVEADIDGIFNHSNPEGFVYALIRLQKAGLLAEPLANDLRIYLILHIFPGPIANRIIDFHQRTSLFEGPQAQANFKAYIKILTRDPFNRSLEAILVKFQRTGLLDANLYRLLQHKNLSNLNQALYYTMRAGLIPMRRGMFARCSCSASTHIAQANFEALYQHQNLSMLLNFIDLCYPRVIDINHPESQARFNQIIQYSTILFGNDALNELLEECDELDEVQYETIIGICNTKQTNIFLAQTLLCRYVQTTLLEGAGPPVASSSKKPRVTDGRLEEIQEDDEEASEPASPQLN